MGIFSILIIVISGFFLIRYISSLMSEGRCAHFSSDNSYQLKIVGVKSYQRTLHSITAVESDNETKHFCIASLTPEQDNPRDRQAIRIDINKRPVGYLSRAKAKSYRRALVFSGYGIRTHTCNAVIVGHPMEGQGDTSYEVRLDLAPSMFGLKISGGFRQSS